MEPEDPMTCIHPAIQCSTDCTCSCDLCREEAEAGHAAAVEMHRRTRLDLIDSNATWEDL